jgi:hippurate hydrolase
MTRLKFLVFTLLLTSASAQTATHSKEVDLVYPDAHALYLAIHQNPELSSHETQTAAKLAAKLRSLGYD